MNDSQLSILSESSQKNGRFFRRPVLMRLAIYPPVLAIVFFFGIRWIETQITHHPTPYVAGAQWKVPANGEEVWFADSDGLKLNGWLIHAKTERVGAVLYCHGNGGNLTNVNGIAQDLAAQGLDVLIFDYRGYGRSEGGIPSEDDLYADADAAYDFLINQRGVQPERLAIYGLSLGTTAAIDVASRRKCGALIVESGLSSASEMADIALPWLPRWLHWIGRNRFESARKIANVKCPVFVAHGTADDVIPTEQGRKLFTAAPEPKKLMIIEGGDHWLSDTVGVNYLKTVGTFIVDALKAGK